MVHFLLWAMLIIPWLSIFLIEKNHLKRFMPVAILGSLLVTIIFEIGYVYHWWDIQQVMISWGKITSIPLVYGIFFIGTIWIFHFTFDKGFLIYLISNAIVEALYAFVGLKILVFFGVYELKNMGHFGIFLLMLLLALILYVYQKWQQTIMVEDKEKY